jgi:hypothetical protein
LTRDETSKTRAIERYLVWGALGTFVASLVVSLARLRYPNYGGDELWFATPLATGVAPDLRLFEFEYAGPLKTLLAWPLFSVAGFGIVTVRLFSLALFVATVMAWCASAWRRRMPLAAAAALAFFAAHADLQFFARDDINQPTFHDLVVLLHFLAFLAIVERGPTLANSACFLVLSFVDVNDHIRNVWLTNAFVLGFAVDQATRHGVSWSSFSQALRRGWPIFAGAAVGAAEALYVLVHFASSPGLRAAEALGDGYGWDARAKDVVRAILELVSGGRVLSGGYETASTFVALLGGVVLGLVALVWFTLRGVLRRSEDADVRLLRVSLVIWACIVVEYAVTRSAKWPWHCNTLMLFWVVSCALTVEVLWSNRKRALAAIFGLSLFSVFVLNRALLERAIDGSASYKSGFGLAVWNVQCLDAVRAHLDAHPGDYVLSDWGLGRALALELRFAPRQGTTWTLHDSGVSDEALAHLRPEQWTLRAVGAFVTAPDMSDERMGRLGLRFVPRYGFRDELGRDAYQLGHVVREGAIRRN